MLESENSMTKSELTPLQSNLLDMMKWFHSFCKEYDLKYYVLGGTMLGAVRHKGFIPWDDDIDVGLPRKDYQRLAEIMQVTDCGPYVIETPYSTSKDYCYPHTKIYDTRTTLVEKKRRNVVRGVFIDVFPLDGLGESEQECRKNYKPINRKYNFLLSIVGGVNKNREWYKNVVVLVARCIPRFIVREKKLLTDLDRLCASIEYDSSTWICNDLGAWRLKEAMPRDVMGVPRIYQFENTEVFGAADYDAYLTRLYGDWRKLPPKEKQVTHHDFVSLDLDTPYRK